MNIYVQLFRHFYFISLFIINNYYNYYHYCFIIVIVSF